MKKETAMYLPSGILNKDYVEELLNSLLPYDKEAIIKKYACAYPDDDTEDEGFTLDDVFVVYSEEKVLGEIDNEIIVRYLKREFFGDDLLDKLDIDIDDAISYYSEKKLLESMDNDEIARYYEDNIKD